MIETETLSTESTLSQPLKQYLHEINSLANARFEAIKIAQQQTSPDMPESTSASNSADIISFPEYKLIDSSPSEHMYALKEWDGYVLELTEDQFISLLAPLGDNNQETEQLTYPLDALAPQDRQNIRVGSIFRVSCGYTRKRTGTITQSMLLYFRPKSVSAERDASIAALQIRKLFDQAVEPRTEINL